MIEEPAVITKREFTYRDECDLKDVFIANWAFILEAYPYVIIGPFTRERAVAIETIQRAGMLDDNLALDAKWRLAIEEVAAGRSIYELLDVDKRLIVEAWVRLEYWR